MKNEIRTLRSEGRVTVIVDKLLVEGCTLCLSGGLLKTRKGESIVVLSQVLGSDATAIVRKIECNYRMDENTA